jgi:hypothetical protein
MLSNIPQIPQRQPQDSSETKTAAEFIFAIRPVIHVETDPAKGDPGKHGDQHVRHQQHE